MSEWAWRHFGENNTCWRTTKLRCTNGYLSRYGNFLSKSSSKITYMYFYSINENVPSSPIYFVYWKKGEMMQTCQNASTFSQNKSLFKLTKTPHIWPKTLHYWNSMRSKSVSQRYFCMIIILIYHDCDFKKMRIQKLLNRVEKYRWIFLWTTRHKGKWFFFKIFLFFFFSIRKSYIVLRLKMIIDTTVFYNEKYSRSIS